MKNWGAYILLAIGAGVYHYVDSADRDASGQIVGAGTIDVFDLKVGDCFDDGDAYSDEVTTLPAVPCNEPHDNEAYAAFNVSVASYPGDDAMWDMATEECYERFAPFVGRDYESSQYDFFTLHPTRESWNHNDREVVCVIYDMDLDKLTGSVRGSKK